MARRDPFHRKNHGVEGEPHLSRGPDGADGVVPDESNRLDEEPARVLSSHPIADAEEDDPIEHGVFDEPAIRVDPRLDAARVQNQGFVHRLREETERTVLSTRILVFLGLIAVAGPAAILGVLAEMSIKQWDGAAEVISIVVLTPVVEEMMKVVLLLWVVEKRPWLMSGPVSIGLVGIAGGAGFGAIENLMYLNVYFPNPVAELVWWRWTICLPMHMVASGIASIGVVSMWRYAHRVGQPSPIQRAFPWLVSAMIFHGAYNAFAIGIEMYDLSRESEVEGESNSRRTDGFVGSKPHHATACVIDHKGRSAWL